VGFGDVIEGADFFESLAHNESSVAPEARHGVLSGRVVMSGT